MVQWIVQLSQEKGVGCVCEETARKISKQNKEIEKWEFGELIIGRSDSQQGIDTQIDRLAGEFRKNESPDGIHELERDCGRNSGGLGGILPGDEYRGHHPIPHVAGEGE